MICAILVCMYVCLKDKTWINLKERSLNGTGRMVDCVLFFPEQHRIRCMCNLDKSHKVIVKVQA